ncbi:MAG: type II secretion system GspH family protein [Patescibacteria group bacterium]|nr:type II secretion system GspH family protein [Patescibacteria group bacterium]
MGGFIKTRNFLNSNKSFTLVEILIVIGILSILFSAVVLVLNPVEYFKRARDSKRIADINQLALLISNYKYKGNRALSLGSANTLYLSLPSANQDCSDLNLPKLPSGWSYRCVSSANLLKIDGTGWIPINLTGSLSSLGTSSLPIDPTNSDTENLYYFYATDGVGKFVVGARNFESFDYKPGGDKEISSSDGGISDYSYEKGDNLSFYKNENIVINSSVNDLTTPYTPGWDVNLNGTYRPTNGFSYGYNGGVTNPSVGYHAHATSTGGIKNSGGLEYIDENCAYGYCHRWLGFAQTFSTPGISLGWMNGTKVKVRFMAKVNTTSKPANFGLYHWSNASGAYTFGTARVEKSLSKANRWEEISQEFTIDSDWELNSHNVALYLYGYTGSEGRLWIDSVEVSYK